jgi:hypothetical protein
MITLKIQYVGQSVDKKSLEIHATTDKGTFVILYIPKVHVDQIATEKDLNFQELVDTEGIVRAVKEILE